MHVQIDENIDPIRANLPGNLLVREFPHLPPDIRVPPQPRRKRIGRRPGVVTKNLKTLFVMRRQQRQNKPAHRLNPKLRRHIPHAQPPLRAPIILKRERRRLQLLHMPLRPPPMLREQFPWPAAPIKMQHEQKISMQLRVRRRQFHRASVMIDRLLHPPDFFERISEIQSRIGRIRTHVHCPP